MMVYLFATCLLVSIGVIAFMVQRNYNNIDIHFWSIVVILPVILLGYTFKADAESVEDARLAMCFIYLDSTVLPMLVLSSMLKSLAIDVSGKINVVGYSVCCLHLLSIWLCSKNNLFYSSFEIEKTPLGTVTRMKDGPLKITHYIYLILIFLFIAGVLIWCFVKKKDCSKKTLCTYAVIGITGLLFYAIETIYGANFSLLPFLYAGGDVLIAVQYDRIYSHDIECVITDHKKEVSNRGYVAFDKKKQLLGYNQDSLVFIPEIRGKRIDARFDKDDERLVAILYPLIDEYEKNKMASGQFSNGDIFFKCEVTYFYMHEGSKPTGYLIEIQDETADQGYMNLIREYGQALEKEVENKTSHIKYIQEKIVLGLATIIENRDLNTGGHVKRTSDVIKIIVNEMKRQNVGEIDEKYADEIIRSAPMHDLGKISIDNAILNKPGKLTDEEYEIMKTHSQKSGEIVQAILEGVEEEHFVQTAYQLARFHHERWDGRGYPERLVAQEIPLEARIMAVADVYDALVSKRSYKEAMSFEKAREIMLEGMGSQFDPMMKSVFEGCLVQLEEYYTNLGKE